MDQNSENGTDKRNWRERLGIGAADGQKTMPKAADGFKPPEAPGVGAPRPASQTPVRAAPTPVRAAPMAPRPAPRPATPVAPRVAPVAPDALANKLKTQRDAAEKLAVQRVQAAKQKAEASVSLAANATSKPKFSFADEEAKIAVQQQPKVPPMPPVQRPIQTQPPRPAPAPQQSYAPPPNPYAGQVQPPRPQLGVNPGYVMPPAYPQGQPYQPAPPQQGYQPQYQQPPYQQPPAYRPIDPNTGYAPQTGYNPNMRPQYVPPAAGAPQGQPRLQVPQRGGAATGFSPNPRLTNPPQRTPQMPMAGDAMEDEIFEQMPVRPTRRATAGEYQQAYRNEVAYEEEPQRSNGLWMILGLAVLGLLVAIGAVLGYSHYLKPQLSSSNGGTVPVITAPATPTKVVPDKTSATTDQPVKKMIYDRIEGDHEVLGGQVQSTEEPPAQPAGSGANVAPPVDPNKALAPVDNTGTGTDGTPLPLPPPPGGGTGQQGSIEPTDKTDIANVTPAAEQSSAANLSQSTAQAGQSQISAVAAKAPEIPPPPVPGSTPVAKAVAQVPAKVEPPKIDPAKLEPTKLADAATQGAEEISPEKPVVAKKLAVTPKPAKSLGGSPVVLVPPSKIAETTAFAKPKPKSKTLVAVADEAAPADGNSIYGGGADATATPSVAGTDVSAPKKSKSIFDLFKASSPPAAPAANLGAAQPVETVVAPLSPAKPATQVALAAPQATVPAAGTGAYVVQLASFRSRAEATAEYQRLGAKHGPIITRYAPIIEAAQVAGSTRYRLNLGPMASTTVASSVCSSLFAAGERDCIVHRQ